MHGLSPAKIVVNPGEKSKSTPTNNNNNPNTRNERQAQGTQAPSSQGRGGSAVSPNPNEGGGGTGNGQPSGPRHRPSQASLHGNQASAIITTDHNPPKHMSIKIGSLNVRGANSSATKLKWSQILRTMRTLNIAILAVIESHSTETQIENLRSKYGTQKLFYHTYDPDRPRSKGIVIVIDKGKIPIQPTDVKSLEPGRALQFTIPWNPDHQTTLLAIYAPNNPTENKSFWETLREKTTQPQHQTINIMMGDFNLIEDPRDRLPPHKDQEATVTALRTLKNTHRLIDGWRKHNPHPEKAFTFRQLKENGSQSRIDRIYITEELYKQTNKWSITRPEVETDHDIVTTVISINDEPNIGRGRWRIPLFLIDDKDYLTFVEKKGKQLNNELENTPGITTHNPQQRFQSFIDTIARKAQKLAKEKTGKLNSKITKLTDERNNILRNMNSTDAADVQHTLHALHTLDIEIQHLLTVKQNRITTRGKSDNRAHGETINKWWCSKGKPHTPRDTIRELRWYGEPPDNTTRISKEMTQEMAKYHNAVQDRDIPPNEDPADREEKIMEALEDMDDHSTEDFGDLGTLMTYNEIEAALRQSPNDKAPGLNGVPTELYKKLAARWTSSKKTNSPGYDVIKTLLIIFNDVETNGVTDKNLAKGWMCPLYKKKDRRDIVNYRPVTVLNTEYKIFTTALMNRLSEIAPRLIDISQAGFVKGRSIFDQIDLANRMVQLYELTEQEGMILALDQEKAYDRVRHDYLWAVLQRTGIPEHFITTVQALYANAETSIIVNGEISTPYHVRRGVRQGDPLSCLLFDLAIEPMSAMLRKSKDLQGTKIHLDDLTVRKIIISLFADDATVYLSKSDSLTHLFQILDKWCEASGAKFNIEKTVVIPIGPETYRNELITSRKLDPASDETIPHNIKILKDGESTRILGAYIGNLKNEEENWPKTIEKINASLTIWDRSYPTLEGRRLILQMIVGGMTQFKTAAQGMPPGIIKMLKKRIRQYMWDSDSPPPVAMETMTLQQKDGGRKVLDITSRNEAIQIMKLKRLTDHTETRPPASDAALAIIEACLPATYQKHNEGRLHRDPFLQTYFERKNYTSSKLPKEISDILNTARRYNLKLEALTFSKEHRETLPAWNHIGKQRPKLVGEYTTKTTCLKTAHGCTTTKDLMYEVAKWEESEHKNKCNCNTCKNLRQKGCNNPKACWKTADETLRDLKPKLCPYEEDDDTSPNETEITAANAQRINHEEDVTFFNKNTLSTGDLHNNLRIFTLPSTSSDKAAQRDPPNSLHQAQDITVFTDGSCEKNGNHDARAGYGIWFGENDDRNTAGPVGKNLLQSNNIAEMLAIYKTLEIVPTNARLHIKTDSNWCIDMLCNLYEKHQDHGFAGIEHADLIKATAARLKKRFGQTDFEWIKGHIGIQGNEAADHLAAKGREMDNTMDTAIQIPPTFNLTGARLQSMTQAIAYRLINDTRLLKTKSRSTTTTNLNLIREATTELCNEKPSDRGIWKATLKNRENLSTNVRNFIWKLIHGAHKCGPYWEKIPGYEERGICPTCLTSESMQHIIFNCPLNKGPEVWTAVKQLCEKKQIYLPRSFDITNIMAAAVSKIPNGDGTVRDGATRLYQIVISEAAFLIWKLRCERILGDQPEGEERRVTTEEAVKRLESTLNDRLSQDRALTNIRRYKKKALKGKTVLRTWSGTLRNEEHLPKDWLTSGEVLVGMAQIDPRGDFG